MGRNGNGAECIDDRHSDRHGDVVAFLSDPATHGLADETVDVRETHGAMIFLAGGCAYKIKKPVTFAYMDFGTLEKRHAICRRELEINRTYAPDLYCGLVAVTAEPDGTLALDGDGETVEWAIRMRRFPDDALLARALDEHCVDAAFFDRLGDTIAAHHANAPRVADAGGAARIERLVAQLGGALAKGGAYVEPDRVRAFQDRAAAMLDQVSDELDRRAATGFVRRGHGDLHLANILVLDGEPVLFDALEFSEEIATTDILYDLAFVLMDLDIAGHRPHAQRLLTRYMLETASDHGFGGLAALPLFLACRAAVRAAVTIDRLDQGTGPMDDETVARGQDYVRHAVRYLDPPPARLVAIGGFSGTGKTTVARALAPEIGAAPGALHLRSDVERKRLFGAGETERLSAEHYAQAATADVYARLFDLAGRTLAAGHSTVVDATFSEPDMRSRIEMVAAAAGVDFVGLWLDADPEILKRRVAARSGDASDATADIVAHQVDAGAGTVDWRSIDASGDVPQTVALARAHLD